MANVYHHVDMTLNDFYAKVEVIRWYESISYIQYDLL